MLGIAITLAVIIFAIEKMVGKRHCLKNSQMNALLEFKDVSNQISEYLTTLEHPEDQKKIIADLKKFHKDIKKSS